jgi:hypothetical protein
MRRSLSTAPVEPEPVKITACSSPPMTDSRIRRTSAPVEVIGVIPSSLL